MFRSKFRVKIEWVSLSVASTTLPFEECRLNVLSEEVADQRMFALRTHTSPQRTTNWEDLEEESHVQVNAEYYVSQWYCGRISLSATSLLPAVVCRSELLDELNGEKLREKSLFRILAEHSNICLARVGLIVSIAVHILYGNYGEKLKVLMEKLKFLFLLKNQLIDWMRQTFS